MWWQKRHSGNFGNGRKENTVTLLLVTSINDEKAPYRIENNLSLTFFILCSLPKQNIIIQEEKSTCCTTDIPHFLFTCNFCQICPKYNSTKEKA